MIRHFSSRARNVAHVFAVTSLVWAGCAVAQVGPNRYYFENNSYFTWDQSSNQLSFSNFYNNSGRDVTDIHIELLNGRDNSMINMDLPITTATGQFVVAPGVPGHWSFSRAITTQSAYSIESAYWTPTVPEASTWAMMLIGFGILGIAFHRRKGVHKTVEYS